MNTNPEVSSRNRLRWLIGILAVLVVPLVVIWWPGCRQYPVVTSKESLGLVKLLYTACNTRDLARLAKVELELEKLTSDGRVSPAERETFSKIIALAKANRWEDAEKAAFQFAQDQVGQGSTLATHNESNHKPKPTKAKENSPK